jgi:nucleoside-diphosphate-sugar epimerase
VLVTGASGFIGSHCLPPLIERGYEVHAVASRAPGEEPGVTWHVADLLDRDVIPGLVERVQPSHLLHLAWIVAPGEVISSPVNYDWVVRSLDLLRGFVAAGGRRAVLSGSAYEYDWRYGYCSELLTPLRPATVYGSCKAALFHLSTSIAREAELSLGWVRPFFLYGPREHPDRLVASVTRALLSGRPAPTSHGRQVRDYLHVQDVADAIVSTLDSDLEGAVNIGSGSPVTIREIVTRLGELVGSPELLQVGAIAARASDTPLVVADPSRLTGELGWAPHYDLESGLRHTVDWWRDQLGREAVPA